MLSAGDCGSFPAGVQVCDSMLVDEVRGDAWPMNGTAAFVLERVGAPLGAVIDELARGFGLPVDRARDDVLAFVLALNAQLLLNIEHRGSALRRWATLASLALRLAPTGLLPSLPARRRRLDTGTARWALVTALVAVAPRAALVALLVTIFSLQIVMAAGAAGVVLAVLVGAGAGAGIALHEAGHAAALVGVPAALVLRGRRTFVLHRPVGNRRRIAVALAGPGPVAALGATLATIAIVAHEPLLLVVGLAPAAHALSLTVATGDGRSACGL
jgi:Coenzyme PQQ synthesis protein D (PqqD)